MWVSQFASMGQVQHQVLIINNVKYELRKNADGVAYPGITDPCTFDDQRREAARAEGDASWGSHYLYLAGWTNLADVEIGRLCMSHADGWQYHPLQRNCIHFIRGLADAVVNNGHAEDWDYFREGRKTESQEYLFNGKWRKLGLLQQLASFGSLGAMVV